MPNPQSSPTWLQVVMILPGLVLRNVCNTKFYTIHSHWKLPLTMSAHINHDNFLFLWQKVCDPVWVPMETQSITYGSVPISVCLLTHESVTDTSWYCACFKTSDLRPWREWGLPVNPLKATCFLPRDIPKKCIKCCDSRNLTQGHMVIHGMSSAPTLTGHYRWRNGQPGELP